MILASTILVAGLCAAADAFAQQNAGYFEVSQSTESVTITQGSSRRLKFAYDIPELFIENQEILQATAMSVNEIMVTGLQPGHSTLTVSDPSGRLHEIAIVVEMDIRPLELAYARLIPDSRIFVSPLKQGIALTGFVTSPSQIDVAVRVANDYFGANVINNLQVQSAQNIAIQIKVYEVSRSKLRRLGVDWSLNTPNLNLSSSVAGIISSFGDDGGAIAGGQDFTGSIIGDESSFRWFVQFLEQRDVARILDEPVLITKNGRPAEFLKGGEVPFLIAQGLGTNSFEFRPFGTKLDIVPIIEGNGHLNLEVRAEVSEPSPELGGNTGLPGFKVSRVNTAVSMRTGHTLALAGHYREKSNNNLRGTPGLMDRPILGTMFRKTEDEFNETELLFLITPNFISEVEAGALTGTMPGQSTQAPSDRELYLKAHSEVPRCQDDCPVNRNLGAQPAPAIEGYQMNAPDAPDAPVSESKPQQPARREASQSNGFNWPTKR
jgi:pilus assembly protein CpaC